MKLLLVIVLLMSFSVQALACSCGAWDAQQVMDNADGVYIAIPTEDSKPILSRWPLPRRPISLNQTPFKVIKSYKGVQSQKLKVYHDPQIGTSCEFNFSGMSGVYVIITYKYLGKQVTDACSAAAISPNNSMVTNFLNNL